MPVLTHPAVQFSFALAILSIVVFAWVPLDSCTIKHAPCKPTLVSEGDCREVYYELHSMVSSPKATCPRSDHRIEIVYQGSPGAVREDDQTALIVCRCPARTETKTAQTLETILDQLQCRHCGHQPIQGVPSICPGCGQHLTTNDVTWRSQ